MGNTAVIRLNKRGGLTLPSELRRELLPGTEFIVRRQDRNIRLLPKPTTVFYDLSEEAGSFANALVSRAMLITQSRWLFRTLTASGRTDDEDGPAPAPT